MSVSASTQAAQIAALRRLPKPALWVLAARLKTLSLSVVPVVAGTWYAALHGTWRADVLVAAIISAVAIQVGTNLWNDAADAARGVDTGERLGPPRVTALGLLSGQAVRRAASLTFIIAAVAGLYLAAIGGWPILAIGVASLALGYLYSSGPVPLSMTPIGEVLVVLFFGTLAVGGTSYLNLGVFDQRSLLLGTILGLPAAAVLLLNNHRDRATDRAAGRRTLAILIGENASRLLFATLLLSSVLATEWWSGPACGSSMIVYGLALAFAGAVSLQLVVTPISRAINEVLPKTALVQVILMLALAVSGLACAA